MCAQELLGRVVTPQVFYGLGQLCEFGAEITYRASLEFVCQPFRAAVHKLAGLILVCFLLCSGLLKYLQMAPA